MTEHDIPTWNPVIAGLRQRGIAATIESPFSPGGYWSIIVVTENPDEMVMIGSHRDDDPAKWEASIDREAGPLDNFIVYRQINDTGVHVTDDFYTQSTDLDELADTIRAAMRAPMKEW